MNKLYILFNYTNWYYECFIEFQIDCDLECVGYFRGGIQSSLDENSPPQVEGQEEIDFN